MMRPMSPEPRMTARRPGRRPFTLTRYCASPAVKMPAGRSPWMKTWRSERSRQPVASTRARAETRRTPSVLELAASSKPPRASRRISSTKAPVRAAAPEAANSAAARYAYSGPASCSRNLRRPKPSWTHWRSTPPRTSSRSRRRVEAPALAEAAAAARPAGPPPSTTTSKASSRITGVLLRSRGRGRRRAGRRRARAGRRVRRGRRRRRAGRHRGRVRVPAALPWCGQPRRPSRGPCA